MAPELLAAWAQKAKEAYPTGLVPIHWFVRNESGEILGLMPFQFPHTSLREDFLTKFTWPLSSETEERLRWLDLPVVDKLWNDRASEKGGFIQEATGWKPSILQPYVYLPALTESAT